MALNNLLTGIPSVPMKVIFMTMFCLVTWASVGTEWIGITYIISNYFVILMGVWSEHDKGSPIPVQMFFFGTIFTLLNDIIDVGVRFEAYKIAAQLTHNSSTFNFNAACIIILILAKPVAILFIYKEWSFRVNGDGVTGQAGNPSDYERLDQSNGGGYGGVYGGGKGAENPPQYQPPSQPFP